MTTMSRFPAPLSASLFFLFRQNDFQCCCFTVSFCRAERPATPARHTVRRSTVHLAMRQFHLSRVARLIIVMWTVIVVIASNPPCVVWFWRHRSTVGHVFVSSDLFFYYNRDWAASRLHLSAFNPTRATVADDTPPSTCRQRACCTSVRNNCWLMGE